MGITVVIMYLSHVMEWHGVTEASPVPIYCDNRETVDFCNDRWLGTTPRWANSQNIELKRTIVKHMRKSGERIQVRHVEAHQDRRTPKADLPLPAKINIICDEGCTRRLESEARHDTERKPRNPLEAEIACLKIDGVPVTTGYKRALYIKKYKKKVADHLRMTIDRFERIDWESHARAM